MSEFLMTCHRKQLQRSLEHTASLLRSHQAVLTNVHLSANEGRLQLRATDGELEPTLLPGKELLRRLRGNTAELIGIQRRDSKCQLAAGSVALQLTCAADEQAYPAALPALTPPVLKVRADDLRRSLATTKPAIATNPSRYAINGVLLEAGSNHLRFVATDGRRLAYDTIEGVVAATTLEAIVPRKAVDLLLRLTRRSTATIELCSADPHLQYCGDGWRLTTPVIDGAFPKYRDVVPKPDTQITVNRAALLELLESMADVSATSSDLIALDVHTGALQLTAVSAEGVSRARASLPISESAPDPITPRALNVRYLRDVLRTLSSTSVTIDFGPATDNQQLRPVQFLPGDASRDTRWVVMPVFVPTEEQSAPAAAA